MRRVLFDRFGSPRLYLTGAGVVFSLLNEPLGWVQEEGVMDSRGRAVAWFDGSFLWDCNGYLLGFVKGATPAEGFALPRTQPLTAPLTPQKAPLVPFRQHAQKPEPIWTWAEADIEAPFRHLTI